MLKKSSFKLIFDILFFIVVMNAIATLIMLLINGFDISRSNSIYEPENEFSTSLYIGAINEIIFSVAFVFVAYHLRKTARLFMVNAEFKSFNLAKHLKRSGQFLVVIGVCLMIKKIFLTYHFEVTHHFFQSNSVIYLLLVVVGLSFIRLSKMLQLSIEAKQEHDLTI
ncbi:DUF2975 domain-containing protein [Psychroflexus sediminis]|uniref:DUF2975 domain-containing protein n=1 Tax=Psychroflexus sediminis TaxID=470826 RepID=A0A1G7X1G3_9FLAO|nr:DUF2975 domain-containing protein [Psychroflexus sediminis]SDG78025.1 hypothetical protein SAMN04488027_10725 [Psychroflexus sediminis]